MPTQTKPVLIITNSKDEHVTSVCRFIEKYGGKLYRLDIDTFKKDYAIEFSLGQNTFSLTNSAGTITSDQIHSLWIRRAANHYPQTTTINQVLIKQEVLALIRTLPNLTKKTTLVVDKPQHVYFASQKLHQLTMAQKFGLETPETIITTLPTSAKQFCRRHNFKVIAKPIDSGYASSNHEYMTIYTNLVDKNYDLSLVKNCPTLFQKHIEKQVELRITIIGEKVFAFEIDSQKFAKSRVDWRRVIEIKKIPHRLIKLPPKLEKNLLRSKAYYHLNYAAIDMAKTKTGEYVFFELNPVGQFLWLEDLTGVQLTSEMAKSLLRGVNPR